MYFFCKCLSLHQSLRQKERKHSGWAALVVKAVAKKGSLLTHSSTEVPEQVILITNPIIVKVKVVKCCLQIFVSEIIELEKNEGRGTHFGILSC